MLNLSLIPQHVAIIMDGNGRWAKHRDQQRYVGHRAGAENIENIVKTANKYGVKILTLFALSTENWKNRPPQELDFLIALGTEKMKEQLSQLLEQNIQLRTIGDISVFPETLQHELINAQKQSSQNTGLKLIFAVNYGGRWDIVQAAKKIIQAVQANTLTSEDIDEKCFGQYLSLTDLPDPDLLIRTAGNIRISNFLLWNLAYAELYFTDTFWPDFNEREFLKALKIFADRHRRFGGLDQYTR